MSGEIVKDPVDLVWIDNNGKKRVGVCVCGNNKFYVCGATSLGETIYECTKCGRISYGLD